MSDTKWKSGDVVTWTNREESSDVIPIRGVVFGTVIAGRIAVTFPTEEDPTNTRDYKTKFPQIDDLIPYVEPPLVNWSAMPAWANWVGTDPVDGWCWYACKPAYDRQRWVADGDEAYGNIPSAYSPTFSGSWKDSLVERPKS